MKLSLDAIEALARMGNAGVLPLRGLIELKTSPALPASLQAAAATSADTIDPLLWAEYHLEESDYDNAIAKATEAAAKPGDAERTRRVANARGTAHRLRSLTELKEGKYELASTDLSRALESGAEQRIIDDALDSAQQMGYDLHEQVALTDVAGFMHSYRMFSTARLHSRNMSNESMLLLEANLADASLTVGRYDEASTLSRSVVERASSLGHASLRSTILNAKFLDFAALTLKGDAAAAAGARQDLLADYESLPAGFINDWSYAGTLRYLDHISVTSAQKAAVRDVIAKISIAK
jgi:tetratricopeptide (TPR) repeat protein